MHPQPEEMGVRTIRDFMKSLEYGYYILDGEVSVKCCTWDCAEVQLQCCMSVFLSMGASAGGLVVTIIW